MPCARCERIQYSHQEKPFTPPPGESAQNTHVCPECGQRWWCFNAHYRLWSMVDDDATWANILSGCHEQIAIGNPSVNYPEPIG